MPYLEGERTPPLPDARSQLLGLTLANMNPANIARATIEACCGASPYGVEVLREQTGEISSITLTRRSPSPRLYARSRPRFSGTCIGY